MLYLFKSFSYTVAKLFAGQASEKIIFYRAVSPEENKTGIYNTMFLSIRSGRSVPEALLPCSCCEGCEGALGIQPAATLPHQLSQLQPGLFELLHTATTPVPSGHENCLDRSASPRVICEEQAYQLLTDSFSAFNSPRDSHCFREVDLHQKCAGQIVS